MFPFLVALAFAAEPEALAVAAPQPEPAPWHIAAGSLPDVADPTGVEAVFARYGVDTQDASLVTAKAYTRSPAERRVRIRRLNLGDGVVTEPLDLRPARGCAAAGEAWGGGALKVHTVSGPAIDGGEAVSDPAILLVRDNPSIGSLVIMRPGDTLEVREVRRNGKVLTKSVVVHRRADRLELRREGDRQWICSGRKVWLARRGSGNIAG